MVEIVSASKYGKAWVILIVAHVQQPISFLVGVRVWVWVLVRVRVRVRIRVRVRVKGNLQTTQH